MKADAIKLDGKAAGSVDLNEEILASSPVPTFFTALFAGNVLVLSRVHTLS